MQTLFSLLDGSHDMVVDKGDQEVIDNKNMLVFNLGELPMAFFVEKVVILEQPVGGGYFANITFGQNFPKHDLSWSCP